MTGLSPRRQGAAAATYEPWSDSKGPHARIEKKNTAMNSRGRRVAGQLTVEAHRLWDFLAGLVSAADVDLRRFIRCC